MPDPTKPNILYIFPDDQPAHTLAKMPYTQELLVRRALEFVGGKVCDPLCGPARATVLRGQYTHNHRITNNDALRQFNERDYNHDNLATRLRAVGYRTSLFGKYLNGYDGPGVPMGWDRWFALMGDIRTVDAYAISDQGAKVSFRRDLYPEPRALGEAAELFVREQAGSGQPWFAWVTPSNPHAPYTPSAESEHLYDGASYSSPSVGEEDLSDKPPSVRQEAPWTAAEQADADRRYEGMLEELADVDREIVRRLLVALEETGQLANTLIVYSSDNGLLLGEHGLAGEKKQPYEQSVGVPFLIAGSVAGVVPGESTALVNHADITATICGMAGADGSGHDGRSLSPLFGGAVPKGWRKRMLIEHLEPGYGFRMVADNRHVYVERALDGSGARELYDKDLDPDEMESRHADPAYAGVKAEMAAHLDALKGASEDALRAAES